MCWCVGLVLRYKGPEIPELNNFLTELLFASSSHATLGVNYKIIHEVVYTVTMTEVLEGQQHRLRRVTAVMN